LAFAKKLSGVEIRKVCWVHEGEFAYELFSSCPGLYGRDGCYDFRDLFKYVDEVYCVSEYSKKVAEKYTDKQIRILPYYIKDDYRGDRGLIIEKDSKLRIGMFGTVEKRKGIKLLDSAVRMLPIKIRKNITFFLCGGITNDAIPNESFQYLGKLPHGMLLEGYNKIDLLICPSLDDPLPISVCEALMMECPVAVSKNTGFYSLLHDNQFVFECDNAELKDCLVQIYEERDSLIGIGKTGRLVYLDNFTKDKFNESVMEMIKGSLSED
jgi:glycosyltransferase involved in cell wall biosynthesis